MSSVNKVILVGNLGRDPEVRTMESGGKVVTFSMATSEYWKDKATGERKQKTEWHRVAVFNEHIGSVIETYVKKGSKIYLEGQLQTRKWAGQDGKDNYTTQVVLGKYRGELQMLSTRANGPGLPPDHPGEERHQGTGDTEGRSGSSDLDDEIPS